MTANAVQNPIRIPPLPREEWTDAARAVFSFWGEPDSWENGSRTNTVMVLANHPRLAMAYNTFGKHLLIDSTLPVRPRELVVLRTSWLLKSEYEWHYHVGYALNFGMTLEDIAEVGVGPNAATWNEQDRAVLLSVDELVEKSNVSNATWAILSPHFSRHQIMDLIFTIGNYVMFSWAISAMGIQLEDGVDRIGFDLRTASGLSPRGTFRPNEKDGWSSNAGLDGA
ncbi:MAG: carboxymuconolactone decarboxylase family protein [Sphingomicrobium sp.]